MIRPDHLLARGLLPDWLVRVGIRRRLGTRLRQLRAGDPEHTQRQLLDFLAQLDRSPIAIDTAAANAQHYEVPAGFYSRVLGRHGKYSCGLWTRADATLDEAEAAMLQLCCERAEVEDGMQLLDLGCGWGALLLWMAEHYPQSSVLGVSNSHSQRQHILATAQQRGLHNVEVVTADINQFDIGRRFDRVLSVEMMEHTRNWKRLLQRIAGWLHADGQLFVHVFTHKSCGYAFDDQGAGDWMARHFFTGGQMPADSQMLYCQDDLRIEQHWRVSGVHYQRTAEAWLANFDRQREELWPLLQQTYGTRARAMRQLWRVFFMACAELWGYRSGSEWLVSHYLMSKRPVPNRRLTSAAAPAPR